jgi:hypothetical protein
VLNNFNVNVNISGGASPTLVRDTASSVMANALPTLSGTPDEIKKNSSINFQETYEEDSGDGLVNIFASDTPAPVDLMYKDLSDFETAAVSHYTYSESSLKENNVKINNQYEVLKNVIHSSIENENIMNVTPYSANDASLYLNQTTNTDESTYNNFNIENTSNTNFEALSELSRNNQRIQNKESNNLTKTVRRIEDMANTNAMEENDVQEAVQVGIKGGAGPSLNFGHDGRIPVNINNVLNDRPEFIEKMNRPPIWRSVLG